MSRADDLTRLRDEMETGHASRVAFVGDLSRNVAELREENQAEIAERRRNVGNMLAGFGSTHAEMAEEERKTLAANEARRMQEAENDHSERVAFVGDMRRTVADMRKENQAEIAERRSGVGEMLSGFRTAHAEMAREQRKALDANEAERKQEAEEAHAGRVAFVGEMKKTVAGLREGFQAENAAAHRAWSGPTPAERRAMERAERRRANAEAEEAESQAETKEEKKPRPASRAAKTTRRGRGR